MDRVDSFDFKKLTGPLIASEQVKDMEAIWGTNGTAASPDVPQPMLDGVWGTNGVAAGGPVLEAIWGTGGVAFEDPLLGYDDPTFA